MQVTYETAKQQYEDMKKSLEPLLKQIKEIESERNNLKKNSKNEVKFLNKQAIIYVYLDLSQLYLNLGP